MGKKRQPEIGDKIEHTCNLNGTFQGVVIEILGMQFVYKTDSGNERHCLFREQWKFIK